MEYMRSFLAQHILAFGEARGPSTSLYSLIPLAVSTAISVTLAVVGTLTDFILKCLCRARPGYLQDSHCGAKAGKIVLHVLCNVALSIGIFIPAVLSVASDEFERTQPFYSWDLTSSDVEVPFEADGQFRVLYLVTATSFYFTSQVFETVVLALTITCFIVASSTVWRCNQIFRRYSCLLQQYHESFAEPSSTGGTGPSASQEADGAVISREQAAAAGKLRAFKAIDMTEAEYLEIIKGYARLMNNPSTTAAASSTGLPPQASVITDPPLHPNPAAAAPPSPAAVTDHTSPYSISEPAPSIHIEAASSAAQALRHSFSFAYNDHLSPTEAAARPSPCARLRPRVPQRILSMPARVQLQRMQDSVHRISLASFLSYHFRASSMSSLHNPTDQPENLEVETSPLYRRMPSP